VSVTWNHPLKLEMVIEILLEGSCWISFTSPH